jgi:toluene monooxygenase electron transfer component
MLAARTELHSAISDPAAQDAHLWAGHRGYIHEVVGMVAHERLADCEFYVCGPARMVEAVQGLILARGVPRERLHFDSFY